MKRGIIIIILALMAISFASATIIINQQPDKIYNLGDTVSVPVTIKSASDISGSFQMDMICSGHQINFYKNGVKLAGGEEKKLDPSVVLTKNVIGELSGDCKIKGIFAGDYVLTSDFRISTFLTLQVKDEGREFSPGEEIIISGDALKENGEDADGFIDFEIVSGNSSILVQSGTIDNGFFSITVPLPEDMPAGEYLVKLDAYEKDTEEVVTNHGVTNFNIMIIQVPTNLEIVFENQEVEPGTNLRVKAVLHDQSGENIESSAIITVKDSENTILEQTEKTTNEFLEHPIVYNEPSAEWTVVAISNKIKGEGTFQIKDKEAVKIELINKTVVITNVGNVPYNKSASIKIGNESKKLDVVLGVDESKKFVLTAPDGEYQVQIIAEGGNEVSQRAVLTGRTIEIKESSNVLTLARYPVVWIFIIAIMGFVAFIVFKKGYKRSFFGYVPKYFKKKDLSSKTPPKKGSLVDTKNRAELSLSIEGNKQNTSIVCLKIKNFKEIKSNISKTEDTFQNIIKIAESKKAVIYENNDNLFFMLVPAMTKTFSNEKTALDIANLIKEELGKHNKLFKQKIDFGISLNYGAVVLKKEKDVMKFMSMGILITSAKKLASISDGEIFIGENINSKLKTKAKTEKHEKEGASYYTIKEIKKTDQHKRFLDNFVKKLENENKEKKKSK